MVITAPPLKFHGGCKLKGDWPWAEQNCTLSMGSWVYDMTSLDIDAQSFSPTMDVINMNWMKDERVRNNMHSKV